MELSVYEDQFFWIKRIFHRFTATNCILFFGWLLLVVISHATRPIFYTSEILYTNVAWDTWQFHHFSLLPVLNGQPYAEKGPLMFWLIQAGWSLWGVSEWWVRFLNEAFGLATLFLVKKFASLLWPDNKELPNLAAIILLGVYYFFNKIVIFNFDIPMTFFSLLAAIYLVSAVEKNKIYWLLLSITLLLGLLTKGPILFLFILPAAIFLFWWAKPVYLWRTNYLFLGFSLLFSSLLAAIWLTAVTMKAGTHYADNLLYHRLLVRIWHRDTIKIAYWRQNWFYYSYVLVLMLFPWVFWGVFWQSLKQLINNHRLVKTDKKIGLLFIIIITPILVLSFVVSKNARYILPVLPFVCILIAYLLNKFADNIKKNQPKLLSICYIIFGAIYSALAFIPSLTFLHKFPWLRNISPVWGIMVTMIGVFGLFWKPRSWRETVYGISIGTLLLCYCMNMGRIKAQSESFDWQNFANQINQLQIQSYPLAALGDYHQLHFFTRHSQSLKVIKKDQVRSWAKQHPRGWLVLEDTRSSPKSFVLIPANQYSKVGWNEYH